MNSENIKIGDKQLAKFDYGFITVCNAVAKTLGGEGKLAVLENTQNFKPPTLTKDGVSVAERIRFGDIFMNFGGIQAVSAASQTLLKSGDSTTTCLVFARGFLRNIKRKNFNKKVEKGIEIAVQEVKDNINLISRPVDNDLLTKIATTSANNDIDLGNKIVEAFKIVGKDGIVEVKKVDNSTEIKVVPQKGFKINKGFISPFFMNKQNKGVWEAENSLVVCLETWQEDETIINFLKNNRKDKDGNLQPMFIYMEKENNDFIQRLIDLIQQKHIDACLVIPPDGHSEFKVVNHLKDLALFTEGVSYKPKDNEIVHGYADKIIVSSDSTVIIKETVSNDVLEKVKELKELTYSEETQQRIQRFEGTSCMIEVGGNSTNDINEKFDRVEDALSSVKSAVSEGYIAGGGSTLVHLSANYMTQKFDNKDVQLGYNLVKEVIKEPFKQILLNANRKQKSYLLSPFGKDYMKFSKRYYGVGYNATTDEVSNLISDGIIDSAKSIKVALDSAKEVAIKVLLTQVIVTFPQKEERE